MPPWPLRPRGPTRRTGRPRGREVRSAPLDVIGASVMVGRIATGEIAAGLTDKRCEMADFVRITDEYEQRQKRAVALYWPGAREGLIVEPLRGTLLPIRAMPFSRRFPCSHSRVSDIPRHDVYIPLTLA
jgi:hypothetical protein